MTVSSLSIKHVFWDWNGTLLNDSRLCSSIINDILIKHGLQAISYARYRQTFDFPVRRYYERLGLAAEGVSFEQTSAEFIENYRSRWKICSLQPRAQATLTRIRELGISQSIITAGEETLLRGFVKHHQLQDYFIGLVGVDHIYASGKLERAKKYAESLKIKQGEILMIGDTVHDHEVAMSIGAKVLLFSKGHHPSQKLRRLGSPVISCLSSVLEYL